jgi:hypothetical protein
MPDTSKTEKAQPAQNMETTNESPTFLKRSPLVRFFRWLFTLPIVKRCLFILAVLATVFALVYEFDNVRGKRVWARYKAEMEAQGEKLDWKAFIPPTVPNDQNFAASPFFILLLEKGENSPAFKKRWPENYGRAADTVANLPKKGPTDSGRKSIDLLAWQAAFTELETGEPFPQPATVDARALTNAAASVLEHLKVYEPVLEELRESAARPASRFDLQYDIANPMALLLPHLAKVKNILSVLQLRANAELALGQNDKAFQDLLLTLRIGDSVRDEPLIISYLVNAASFRISTDLLWQGLAQNQWSAAQLQTVQARLEEYDWLARMQKTLRAERAYSLRFFEYLRRKPSELTQLELNTFAASRANSRSWRRQIINRFRSCTRSARRVGCTSNNIVIRNNFRSLSAAHPPINRSGLTWQPGHRWKRI